MTPEQRSTIARKAWETRKRRTLERSLQTAATELTTLDHAYPDEVADIDLVLPRKATRTQVSRSLEGFRRMLKQYLDDSKPQRVKPPVVKSKNETIIAFFSDTHFGKLILDEEDPGTVLFSAEIGAQRVRKVLDEALIQAEQRNADEIVVLMGGDMIDGEGIYFTQAMHIEQSAIDQVKETSKGFFTELRRLATLSKLPVRVVGCPGNHGRTSKTADELSNWDQMIYIILDLLSQESKDDITVEYPSTRQFIVTTVKGQKILLRHKAKRGTTPSPISQWQNWILQHNFDIAACGHWHTPAMEFVVNRPVFRNGSLCGKDDFAESLGLGDGASQWIWGVSEEEPVTFAKLVTF